MRPDGSCSSAVTDGTSGVVEPLFTWFALHCEKAATDDELVQTLTPVGS